MSMLLSFFPHQRLDVPCCHHGPSTATSTAPTARTSGPSARTPALRAMSSPAARLSGTAHSMEKLNNGMGRRLAAIVSTCIFLFYFYYTAKTVVLTGIHRGPHQAFCTSVKFLVLAQHPVVLF